MSETLTPHIAAKKGDFAKTVLMPGDPLRAKFIAETYLKDAVLVTGVRGILGYTGTWNGKRVSVMASGMGCPSIGIYSYELFTQFDVECIIRIGSAGSIDPRLKLFDLVLAQGACTDSNFGIQYRLPGTFAPIADFALLRRAVNACETQGCNFRVGNVFTSDIFYDDAKSMLDWRKMGVLACEMETAALYMNAARLNKRALSILTISDDPNTNERATVEQRQTAFDAMIRVALEAAE